ncbi:hypothetical protein ACLJYM_28205 [Rhizobium giardinii]|uniref:hypothetical protein n=1 Tax=Rhizobium giardinii TaxID=56731 RepID=UPI0039E082B9
MSHFDAQRAKIVQAMFIATADQNYIQARIAYQRKAAFDFLWLSLHALEKYFKAIRLLNRMPRMDGHDIASLHAQCIARFPGLVATKFNFNKAEKSFWHKENVKQFVVRLNAFGAAENRYGVYGYSIFPDDLAKVDTIVWSVRRCCIDFEGFSKFRDERHGEKESVELLKSGRKHWMLGGHLPIERLLSNQGDEDVRERFLRGNKPWGAQTWIADAILCASANSPFTDLIHLARNGDGVVQQEAKSVLRWAVQNIYFSPSVLNELCAVIGQEANSQP